MLALTCLFALLVRLACPCTTLSTSKVVQSTGDCSRALLVQAKRLVDVELSAVEVALDVKPLVINI